VQKRGGVYIVAGYPEEAAHLVLAAKQLREEELSRR
jgi:hypothetical protein